MDASAIVLLHSLTSLVAFNNQTRIPTSFSKSHQIFVYCQNWSHDDLPIISVSTETASIIQNEYFVVKEETSVRLLTFVWYTPNICGQPQLVEVNRFDKLKGRWLYGDFKIDKFANFHGCQISFLVTLSKPEYYGTIDSRTKEVTDCVGYICAALKDFSSALNFGYRVYKYDERSIPKLPYDVHLQVTFLSSIVYLKDIVYTRPTFSEDLFFAVPPGEKYNGFEKLCLPFDDETWLWIAITFSSAFVTIFVLKFVKKSIADFVIGAGNTTPVLNVIRAFFGISQIASPEGNFARFLLMMLILFSLIIRTAYQGVMFDFLQKDMRKPGAMDIEEIIDNNFTIYMPHGYSRVTDLHKRLNLVTDNVLSMHFHFFSQRQHHR